MRDASWKSAQAALCVLGLASGIACESRRGSSQPAISDGAPGCRGLADSSVRDGAAAAGYPTVLAQGLGTPGPILVDQLSVYWVNQVVWLPEGGVQQISTCAKCGCGNAPTILAQGNWGYVTNIVLVDGVLYWGTPWSIYACKATGCGGAPTAFQVGSLSVEEIAVNPRGEVYFAHPNEGSTYISECADGSCNPGVDVSWIPDTQTPEGDGGVFLQYLQPLALVVDSHDLYVAASAFFSAQLLFPGPGGQAPSGLALVACSLSSCETTKHVVAATQKTMTDFAVDGTAAYFSTGTATGIGAVERVPTDGSSSTSTTLIDGLSSPTAIALDGTYVYVAERGDVGLDGGRAPNSGRISRCAVAGCGGIAEPVRDYVEGPGGLAVDDTNIDWTEPTASGRVMVQAK